MHPHSFLLTLSSALWLKHTASRAPSSQTMPPLFFHPNISTSHPFQSCLQIKPLILVLIIDSSAPSSPAPPILYIFNFKCIRQPPRSDREDCYSFSFSLQPLLLPHQEEISYLITVHETDKMPISPPIYNDHLILQASHKEQNLHAGPSYFYIVINNLSMRGWKTEEERMYLLLYGSALDIVTVVTLLESN